MPQRLYEVLGMVSTRSVRKVLLIAIASPLNVMISTTNYRIFWHLCVGHAAVNARLTVAQDTKPTKMHQLCKNMQKAVQHTPTVSSPSSAPVSLF